MVKRVLLFTYTCTNIKGKFQSQVDVSKRVCFSRGLNVMPLNSFIATGYERNKFLIYWYVNELLLNVIFQWTLAQIPAFPPDCVLIAGDRARSLFAKEKLRLLTDKMWFYLVENRKSEHMASFDLAQVNWCHVFVVENR